MKKWIRFFWAVLNIVLATVVCTIIACGARLFGWLDRKRKYIGCLSWIWSKWILASLDLNLKVEGLESVNPKEKYVVIANHQSALDVFLVPGLLPLKFTTMGKKEIFYIPILNLGIMAMDVVPVYRKKTEIAKKAVDRSIKKLKKTVRSFFIFPEGTRSKELLPFKKGGFLIAIALGYPILPVTIKGAGEAWPAKNFFGFDNLKLIEVIIDEPISTQDLSFEDRNMLLAQTRNVIKRNLENT